jgi:hypothetical protein
VLHETELTESICFLYPFGSIPDMNTTARHTQQISIEKKLEIRDASEVCV